MLPTSKLKSRKSPEDIVRAIFAELEKGGTKTPNEIGVAISTNTQTVKRGLEIIKIVQSKPKVIVESGAKFTLIRLEI